MLRKQRLECNKSIEVPRSSLIIEGPGPCIHLCIYKTFESRSDL